MKLTDIVKQKLEEAVKKHKLSDFAHVHAFMNGAVNQETGGSEPDPHHPVHEKHAVAFNNANNKLAGLKGASLAKSEHLGRVHAFAVFDHDFHANLPGSPDDSEHVGNLYKKHFHGKYS